MSEIYGSRERYEFSYPFLFSPASIRLVQIQPTLRCNLRCLHCYSESGPQRHEELQLSSLKDFLIEARQLGYSYVGISGGEPLLWQNLEEFLDFAKSSGFSTSLSTNGTMLTRERAEKLRDLVGVVAVSVDGPPEDHGIIRGSHTAFPLMQTGLSALRDAGIPFTLAFTLTKHNAHRMSWLYSFAREAGAAGIHVHPLSMSGAATKNLADAVPDSLEFKIASIFMAIVMAQDKSDGPAAIFDVIQRSVIEESNWLQRMNIGDSLPSTAFSELVPALVVEPDGCIVPFTYGFPRRWLVGHLGQGTLEDSAGRWLAASSSQIARLLHDTLIRLAADGAEFVDLFGELMSTASYGWKADLFRER